jgi:nucleotide-binding universal stress UspA family protein
MLDLSQGVRIEVKNVLYLTDFSKSSQAVVPIVRGIANAFDANVHVLHVILPDSYTGMALEMAPAVIGAREEFAKAGMQSLESSLNGITLHPLLVRGMALWPAVEEVIQKHEIDLIIVGTSGKTGGSKLILGSVAEEIFRRSPVPVMTVGPSVPIKSTYYGQFGRVLFATDLTSPSRSAAPYALSFAEENDADLILLHVAGTPETSRKKNRQKLSVAEAMHHLEKLVPPDAAFWCRPELLVEYGEPAERIVAVARKREVDLIVLGVRNTRHPQAAAHLGGSTAYGVIANAPCPVVTVCSRAEAPKTTVLANANWQHAGEVIACT